MSRYQNLVNRMRNGECILIDGATGTEMERRGVPQLENAWNGGGALSDPETLRQVHQDYIGLNAEVIISNTFATHYHALRDAGVADRFEAFNRRGVELAVEARAEMNKPEVLVAGGISYWSWTGNHPPIEELKPAATQQVEIMAAAGADLIMLEMMIDIDRMLEILEAAQSSGLPVWVGLTCSLDHKNVVTLRNGEQLSAALAAISDKQVDLVNIMHTEVEDIDACLEVVRANWSQLVGVYAHSGEFADDKLNFTSTMSPGEYCACAKRWVDSGLHLIGGCCGIGPRHVQALSETLYSN
jgi:S-methylmethionine-dependent homocysteine/selenocysteine methylase